MPRMNVESFNLDHTKVRAPFIRLADIKRLPHGDVLTKYDIRFCQPGREHLEMKAVHSIEHSFAEFSRNHCDTVVDFSPMGCQTGFYLLVRGADHHAVLDVLRESLQKVIDHEGAVFGASRKECGNYRSLDLEKAKDECRRYLDVVRDWTENDLEYPRG